MLSAIRRQLSRVWAWVTGVKRPRADAKIPMIIAPSTAVAGFVYRLEPTSATTTATEFHLSARLASVAHLNTRAGRVPSNRQRPNTTNKAMPKLQQHLPKRSVISAQKPRYSKAVNMNQGAQVVALIQPTSRCIPLDIRIARAA